MPNCSTTTKTRAPAESAPFEHLVARVNRALDLLLPQAATAPQPLHRAMRHAVLAGGKRLRPLLVYASGAAMGISGPALDAPACAVELIHTYSLIHDDLPAMDDDDLRRGLPTCHVIYGEAMAILAGDALQALAFEVLAGNCDAHTDAATCLRMLQFLASACGSSGMAGGQALDLAAVGANVDAAALEHMHHWKTGALIRASVRLGALAGGCQDTARLAALDSYAQALGLAFQIRDDILDVESDTGTLGKTAGKDARQAKPTFPSVIGLDASRARLTALVEQASAAIAEIGPDAGLLRQLARFAATRRH